MKFLKEGEMGGVASPFKDVPILVYHTAHPPALRGVDVYYTIGATGLVESAPSFDDLIAGAGNVAFALIAFPSLGFRPQNVKIVNGDGLGRCRYINGASVSLLVYPPRLGNPCVNYLYFPSKMPQDEHTHPSARIGFVIEGEGEAHWREQQTDEPTISPLKAGEVFLLAPGELHSFHTKKSHMKIIAFHPDSDWGPIDEDHPVLNRTIMPNGQRAKAG